jgi:hypothetical protein
MISSEIETVILCATDTYNDEAGLDTECDSNTLSFAAVTHIGNALI